MSFRLPSRPAGSVGALLAFAPDTEVAKKLDNFPDALAFKVLVMIVPW